MWESADDVVEAKSQNNSAVSKGDKTNDSKAKNGDAKEEASMEQPVSKRQRIDAVETQTLSKSAINHNYGALSDGTVENIAKINGYAPPDILSSTIQSNGNQTTIISDDETTTTTIPIDAINRPANVSNTTSTSTGSDSVDNVSTINMVLRTNGLLKIQHEYPDLVQTGIDYDIDKNTESINENNTSMNMNSNNNDNNGGSDADDSGDVDDELHSYLAKQCLCKINGQTLRRSFLSHCHIDVNGVQHSVLLTEWPTDKLIKFLSNVQLLFDVYLKQNAKGQICLKIMEVCCKIVQNEYNIIDEIFQLHEYNNRFVQFLAARVVASCMEIAKDKRDLYDSWLMTLVANLTAIENSNYATMRKINFSLEIILRILEWRDIEEHPLEDSVAIDSRALGTADGDSDDEQYTLPLIVPPIENNYFAIQFHENGTTLLSRDPAATAATAPTTTTTAANHRNQLNNTNDIHASSNAQISSCRLQILSDSESFDTTDLKLNIVSRLKTKWSYLVDSMAQRTRQLGNSRNSAHRNSIDDYTESIILVFLNLWERIISVQANLSVDSTLPFHEKLTTFEDILVTGNVPITIYKQILTLLNESLCYGTTLALQSVLPEETNNLANKIFNCVKSRSIFNSLPQSTATPMNDIGFIGYKRPTIAYSVNDSLQPSIVNHSNDSSSTSTIDHQSSSVDHTLLQKLVLLILKSIAVTVKPVRGDDSSDSSMDGCSSTSSTEFEAYQATVQIEHATRNVLRKLDEFLKQKLEHHPGTHFSKIIVHLFADQDDYLIEAMVCMLDTTIAFLPRHSNSSIANLRPSRDQFLTLIDMLSPVYAFLEFLQLISNKTELLLDLLVSNETSFLLYLLRFLKYIRSDFLTFRARCNDWPAADSGGSRSNNPRTIDEDTAMPTLAMVSVLDRAMSVLIRLRLQIERLVLQSLYPYDITPIIDLLHQCEHLYEGNDTELY